MATYNFGNLSPYDFEILCRDLLSKVEGIDFRSFAPGRDGGVDLRAWLNDDNETSVIVQCKHMQNSSFPSLLAKIRTEKAKLDLLVPAPGRYILATTKALTEENISALVQELKPHCHGPEDILDIARIEQLLLDHEDVVRENVKLWISSVAVMDRIIHAATFTNSEEFLLQAQKNARIFVQPKTINPARRILHEEHSCVISGSAGVGKTTLASILALEYYAQNFQVLVVEEDIREADALYRDSVKQIFLYDDFLGRNDPWQKLGKNEDARILRFMNRVAESPNHRFVLTTREYILRTAESRYESLSKMHLADRKCLLEMTAYSLLEKGLILYHHLYFSEEIPISEIQDLVERKLYRNIVNHRNYTPRHISDALKEIGRSRSGEIRNAG